MSGAPLSRHSAHRGRAADAPADLARELDRAGGRLWRLLGVLLWTVFVGGGLLTLALGIGASVVYGQAARRYPLDPLSRVGVNFGLLALVALALTVAALFLTGWTRELALRQWAWAAQEGAVQEPGRGMNGPRSAAPQLLLDVARLERLRQTLSGWLLTAQVVLPLWWLLAAALPPLLWAEAAAATPLPPLGRPLLTGVLLVALAGLPAVLLGALALSRVDRWLALSVGSMRGLHTPDLPEQAALLRRRGPLLTAALLLPAAGTLWTAALLGALLHRLALPGLSAVLLFVLFTVGVAGLLAAILRAALWLAALLARVGDD